MLFLNLPTSELFVVFTLAMCLVLLVVALALFFLVFRPWLRAFLSGAKISLFHVIGMKLRRTDVNLIIDALISYQHRGDEQPVASIESCYLAYRNKIHDLNSFLEIYEKHKNDFQR